MLSIFVFIRFFNLICVHFLPCLLIYNIKLSANNNNIKTFHELIPQFTMLGNLLLSKIYIIFDMCWCKFDTYFKDEFINNKLQHVFVR